MVERKMYSEFALNHDEIEDDDEHSGYYIKKEPLDTSKIDITQQHLSIDYIIQRMKHEEINFQTTFQRNMNLWKEDVMSRLIESILIKFPLPAFYFDGTDDNNWLIIDGLQRLSTIKKFILDKTLSLAGLEYRTDLEGKTYDELSRSDQRCIDESVVYAYIIRKGTPSKVKYSIFHRLNTNVLVLNKQEIRHAINQGKPANYIEKLAESEEFKNLALINPERMKDRETVLRHIAFRLVHYSDYTPDISSFLDDRMTQLYDVSAFLLDKYESEFKKSLLTAKELFGRHAFRKTIFSDKQRGRFSNVLFEIWSVALSMCCDEELAKIVRHKDDLLNHFRILMEQEDFDNAISKNPYTKNSVEIRFKAIEDLIKGLLK
jgi:hypothetical protein